MSKEAVMELIEAASEDKVLEAKLNAADSPTSIVKMAAGIGYQFTEEELEAVLGELMEMENEDSESIDMEEDSFSGMSCGNSERFEGLYLSI